MQIKISIFGLGYVGAVSMGCLVRYGNEVIGIDTNPVKLQLIIEGKSPIIEEGMAELMDEMAQSGRVKVTSDVKEAIINSEISFICVGTPSATNGSQDQSDLLRVANEIGYAIRHKEDYHVFVLRSTVTPGTVEGVLKPIIENKSGKKDGIDFDLCFQPEFLREGSSIKDYENPPYTIIGTSSQRAADKLKSLYDHLQCDFHITSVKTAEMVKFCCNNFHALKIAFANEVARLSQALHVNPHEVMDLVCKDKYLNISTAYLKPGFAFGGSCLPKDLRATLYMAKMLDVEIPMLSGVLQSNNCHIEHTVQAVLKKGKRKVGMIGLSFKSGTDDLRESPLVNIAEQFIGKGLQLSIYDPEVNVSQLIGANKRYIEAVLPHIGELLVTDCKKMITQSEIVIVGLNDIEIVQQIHEIIQPHQILVDLINIPNREELICEYLGVCW